MFFPSDFLNILNIYLTILHTCFPATVCLCIHPPSQVIGSHYWTFCLKHQLIPNCPLGPSQLCPKVHSPVVFCRCWRNSQTPMRPPCRSHFVVTYSLRGIWGMRDRDQVTGEVSLVYTTSNIKHEDFRSSFVGNAHATTPWVLKQGGLERATHGNKISHCCAEVM